MGLGIAGASLLISARTVARCMAFDVFKAVGTRLVLMLWKSSTATTTSFEF